MWTFVEGDPLDLLLLEPEAGEVRLRRLGAVEAGNRPLWVVAAGWWQAARPAGEYTLVACSVAPGFEFEDFDLLKDLPAERARLQAVLGVHEDLI